MTSSMHIAPCGLNCSLCRVFQRLKKNCPGCNSPDGNQPWHCRTCRIRYCDELARAGTGFCFSCRKFPCTYLKQMDSRYRIKYGVSVLANLQMIENGGLQFFIESERLKWTCRKCGSLLCVHSAHCLSCGGKNEFFPMEGDPAGKK
jgi:hypothetical protein